MKKLLKLVKDLTTDKRLRETEHLVVVEGKKLVHELSLLQRPRYVLGTDSSWIKAHVQYEEFIEIPEHTLQSLSTHVTPDGVIALFDYPKASSLEKTSFIVVLDAISDPTNLGTIFRSALALGWDGIFLLPSCTDPFSPKAIRASMGACFKIPYRYGDFKLLQELTKQNKIPLYATALEGTPLDKVGALNACALILGSESHGVSKDILLTVPSLTIPIDTSIDSLNVATAAAIFLYTLKGKAL